MLITLLISDMSNTMSQKCFTDKPFISQGPVPDVTPACLLFQKLSPSPQQTQGGSVSSPHASQPSQEESSPCSDMSSYEEPPSPLSVASSGPMAPGPVPAQVPVQRHPSRASDQEGCSERDVASLGQRFLPNDPTKWNVAEVYEFIRSLPGQRNKHRTCWFRTHRHETSHFDFILTVTHCKMSFFLFYRLSGDSR